MLARLRARVANSDSGFTLVELLICVVVLGIISVALADVVITYLLDTKSVSARFNESSDQQITTAFWQQDVASIGVRSAFDPNTGTFPMQTSIASTSSCLPAGVTPLANGVLMWNQYDASGTPSYYSAAYVQTGTTLVRYHCGGASQGSMSVDSTLTLARSLSGTPSISCLTASGGSSCSGSGTDVPVSVSLQMSVADASGKGQPYTVTLTGQRRQT